MNYFRHNLEARQGCTRAIKNANVQQSLHHYTTAKVGSL
jgi:hypothetical protein